MDVNTGSSLFKLHLPVGRTRPAVRPSPAQPLPAGLPFHHLPHKRSPPAGSLCLPVPISGLTLHWLLRCGSFILFPAPGRIFGSSFILLLRSLVPFAMPLYGNAYYLPPLPPHHYHHPSTGAFYLRDLDVLHHPFSYSSFVPIHFFLPARPFAFLLPHSSTFDLPFH